MKRTSNGFLLIVFFSLFFGSSAVGKSAENLNLNTLYSSYIDEFVSRCEAKSEMRKSKLLNIRREAACYCFKACFFKKWKKDLVEDMIAEHIAIKPHRIHCYLNTRFFKTFREAMAAVPHMHKQINCP